MAEHEIPRFTSQQSGMLATEVARKWHPLVRPLVEKQEPGETAVLAINSVPSDIGSWEPNDRITLIADAVNLMGPTTGSGTTTAIRDAEHLCRLLVNGGLSKQTIEKYESMMRHHGGEIVHKSWVSARCVFGQNSGEVRHIARSRWLIGRAN